MSNDASSSSRCPVQHDSSSSTSFWSRFFTSKVNDSSCPVVPSSIEEAARHGQTPLPNQRLPLSTDRQVSSIPRGEADQTPNHQHDASFSHWVYPSSQQLYAAMRRKGWLVEEEAIDNVLAIHNNVNERTWQAVLEYQSNVRLAKFMGRPRDLTPKAWFYSTILGYPAPFDRHDWFVQDSQGRLQRYVIDFYMQDDGSGPLPRTTVDVRPALDGPRAVALRTRHFVQQAFPGLTKAWQQWQQQD